MTKETEKVLKILYCEFKRRRKSGCSKPTAMHFENGSIPKMDAFQNWLPEDISYALQELKTSGFVGSDICGNVTLTETAVEFMQEKPKEFFDGLSSFFDLVGIFI